MRPVYHWNPERIRAHILICFMADVMLNMTIQILEMKSIHLSVAQLRKELAIRQVSIIRDKFTQRKYLVPGAFTETQKQIYEAFNFFTNQTVQPLFGGRN